MSSQGQKLFCHCMPPATVTPLLKEGESGRSENAPLTKSPSKMSCPSGTDCTVDYLRGDIDNMHSKGIIPLIIRCRTWYCRVPKFLTVPDGLLPGCAVVSSSPRASARRYTTDATIYPGSPCKVLSLSPRTPCAPFGSLAHPLPGLRPACQSPSKTD